MAGSEQIHDQIEYYGDSERRLLNAKYLADLSDFRFDVYKKLCQIGAIGLNGDGWAIFRPDALVSAEEGMSLLEVSTREMLVIFGREQPAWPPTIKIVNNELISGGDHGFYMTKDFTVDGEGDAQYFVDGIHADMRPPEIPGVTEAPPLAHISLFQVEGDGDLTPIGYTAVMFSPIVNIDGFSLDETTSEPKVFPFGHYSFVEDRIHALDVGRSLFYEVDNIDPVAVALPDWQLIATQG